MNFAKLRMLSLCVLYLVFVFQDTVIYDRLAETSKYKEITLKHLEQFATEGQYNVEMKHDLKKLTHVSYGIVAVILLRFLKQNNN